MNTRILAVVTQKGGSGKSTIATHLAGEAAKRGVPTCLLDMDPQQTAATWGQYRRAAGLLEPVTLYTSPGKLDSTLATAKSDGFEFAVIDTPGRVDGVTAFVKRLPAQFLIPLRPTSPDLKALTGTLAQLGDAVERAVIVLSQVQQWVAETQEMRDLLATKYPDLRVYPGAIMQRAAYYRALGAGLTVADIESPTSSGQNAAREIADLYDWLHSS